MPETSLESLITECPSCHTRFRVSESQLGMAAGRVRCGACLFVFIATDYMVAGAPVRRRESATVAELDQLLDELARDVPKAAVRPGQEGGLQRPSGVASGPAGDTDPVRAAPASTTSPDAGSLQAKTGPESPEIEATAAPSSVEGASSDDAVAAIDKDERPAAERAPEASVVVATPDAVGAESPIPAPSAPPPTASSAEMASEGTVHATAAPAALQAAEPRRLRRAEATRAGIVEGIDGPTDTFVEPVLAAQRRRRRWWLPFAAVLAGVALAAQVLWFQFEVWSRDLQFRPIYQRICPYVGCHLPVLRALEAMHSRNLVVRSHPDVPGALLVDALLVNEAPYAQPFPLIELRFSSLEGQLVAGRRFKPSEYLAGELQGAAMIEPMTPVHISLEIEDPGADAVNYVMVFR